MTARDDPQSAEAVAAMLEHCGVDVDMASDGGVGLARAGNPTVDLVILDRMLPVMDGMAVAARMRATGLDKPIFTLSALGRIDQRVEGLDGGGGRRLSHQTVRSR